MNLRTCPKCGQNTIMGPKYVVQYGVEKLKFSCLCGHSWTEATRDSKEHRISHNHEPADLNHGVCHACNEVRRKLEAMAQRKKGIATEYNEEYDK